MPTRDQARALLARGLDHADAGRRLGVPAGQAYLIARGQAADGSDSPSDQQRLVNPPHENPAARDVVREWMAARVAADAQMRAAAGQQADGKGGAE